MSDFTTPAAPAATPARTSSPERVLVAYRGPSKRKGFTQIPNVVLLDKSLSHPAKVLYGLMVGYAMQHEAFETDQFAIAADMGCTDRAIRKWMKELLDSGLLTITRRGLNQPNVYVIEDAYALYDQKKPQPKEPPQKPRTPRWDRNNGSGPDRNVHSTPERNAGSGQERNNGSGPYLTRKKLKKEEKNEALLPAAFPEKSPDRSPDKTDRQQQVYQQGTAKVKAALDTARKATRDDPG